MQYRRVRSDGGCYFFTVVTHHRRPILTENIDLLRQAFRVVMQQYPFQIDGIVVMPDHLHCIWQLPKQDGDYSKRWSIIKRHFSTRLPNMADRASLKNKHERGIWQRRFWEHAIRDDNDWQRHMDYLHFNPVKHGYVRRVGDWPYSSFPRCVEKGWYPTDWGLLEPESIRTLDLD